MNGVGEVNHNALDRARLMKLDDLAYYIEKSRNTFSRVHQPITIANKTDEKAHGNNVIRDATPRQQ